MRTINVRTAVLGIALSMTTAVSAQQDLITEDCTARAREHVSKMTLEEKIDYIGGDVDGFSIRAIPRLGIPAVKMADGPQGVRNNVRSTYYPCGLLSAASWNRELVRNVGRGLGDDCNAYGISFILGPGVNIYRSPLCGRNFEYFGEDSYLASETAVEYVLGVQERGVIATIKHFALNNQEWDRHGVSSDADERTMEEIYFPTFRKAVEKAHVGAVMCSYNLVNGLHASENPWLLRTKLRDEWGFKGILMSDWDATYTAFNSCLNGLDLEMPSGKFMNRENLLPLVRGGILPESVIDGHVVNIVRTLIAFGLLDNPKSADPQHTADVPSSKKAALDMAREGIVLLKNDAAVLPLKGKTAVIGCNADRLVRGGGSGEVYPFEAVTPWQGLSAIMGKKVSRIDDSWNRQLELEYKAEYFNNRTLSGTPALVRTEKGLSHAWGEGAPADGIVPDGFSARWTSQFTADKDAMLLLVAEGDDGYRVKINGKEMVADWGNHALTSQNRLIEVRKGETYRVEMEYYDNMRTAEVSLSISDYDLDALSASLGKYDNVVLSLGFDKNSESEGFDRKFALDNLQLGVLNAAIKSGKNVVVVLNSGGAVEMASWLDKVKAVVMAWYPGQEGGTALAEILTGKISTSGKLPISIEARPEDNPTYCSYYENQPTKKRVIYKEGIFMGYRGYDRSGKKPLFPFGFGLSYTTFAYSNLQVAKTGINTVEVSFDVTNTGKMDAAEVSQVYVADVKCSVERPAKELKGYEKTFIKRGATKRVTVTLTDEAFRFYDVENHGFVVEPGEFRIMVGTSSADLPLSATITL